MTKTTKASAHDRQTEAVSKIPGALEALRRFRAKHGRTWKAKLGDAWLSAAYRGVSGEDASALQRVRNVGGPSWLAAAGDEVIACSVCGRAFAPSYGERSRCPDCLASQHDAAERATGVS